MTWSDASRAAALAARRAKRSLHAPTPQDRLFAASSAVQQYRNKLWKKSLNDTRGQAQTHIVRPKWAMTAKQRKSYGRSYIRGEAARFAAQGHATRTKKK